MIDINYFCLNILYTNSQLHKTNPDKQVAQDIIQYFQILNLKLTVNIRDEENKHIRDNKSVKSIKYFPQS